MITAQDMFFKELDKIGKGHGQELVVEYSFSNKGRATLKPRGSFEPTVTFAFQFSTGHNTFDSAGLFPGRSNPDMYLAKDVRQLGEVLEYIRAALP